MTNIDWPEVRLGDVIDIKHGFAFKGEHFADSGDHIVVTPGNFYDEGGFKLKASEKYYTGLIPPDFVLDPGDLLVVMTEQKRGLLGSAGIIPLKGMFLHNQRLGRVVEKTPDATSKRFLYYSFNSSTVRNQIQATANGAKVRHTSPSRIQDVVIHLPPLQVQRKIATVLATYDELIENNLRRIEILDEMAQAIYREWFVDFRYPGHEAHDVVDSTLGPIPEGWAVLPLGDRMELAYGKALKKDDREGGEVAVYGSSGVIGWHDTALVSGPGIIVGRKGNVGAIHWSDVDFHPIDTTFYVKTDVSLPYVFQNLRNQNFINSDAAVPGLNRNQAYANPLLVPSLAVLDLFDAAMTPMIELRQNLEGQNRNLRGTRDLLLPKLISGEIDVSDLNIDTTWLAA